MPSYDCRADVGDMRYYRQNYSLPERLDPPDAASECAICHRVTEDGRDLDLCDEAVEAMHSAAMIRLAAAVETGHQWVCDACLDDLHAAQERCRAEALDTISDALDLDDYEHPALRARKVIQRLKSVSAPVGGGVQDITEEDYESVAILMRDHGLGNHNDESEDFRRIVAATWQCCRAYAVDSARAASRLPAIKPGEVETCEWHPGDIPGTGVRGWKTACGEAMYPKHRWRLGVDGFDYCPNCGKRVVQVSDDEWAAQSAQATNS